MKPSPASERKTVHIDEIKPYWRNPRLIPDEAVDAVRQSIEEFGYMQPVVTDEKGIIVIGTTRYIALRRMGVTEVEVLQVSLSDRQAKELRIIDNRASEYSMWDFGALMSELEKTDSPLLSTLFAQPEPEDFDTSEPEAPRETTENPVDFICPYCFHEWNQKVNREDVFSGKIGVVK